MKQLLINNIVFIACFILCWATLLGLIVTYDKIDLHLMLNSCHSSSLDIFFKYLTKFANFGAYLIIPCLLFKRLADSLFLLSAELLSGLVVQIIKHIVRAPRPSIVFDIYSNPDILPIVDGVNLHTANSFPSGHTSSFVIIFFALSIIISAYKTDKNKYFVYICQFVFMLIAVAGAYSRIYLSQHFAQDVFAGGLIAFFVTPICYLFIQKLADKYPHTMNWKINISKSI